MKNLKKSFFILNIITLLFVFPCFSLDLDSTVTDKSRQTYTKQTQQIQVQQKSAEIKQTTENAIKSENLELLEIKQDLPKVPPLPKNVNSTTVAPINTRYSGKMPNSEALIPATDIKAGTLIIDDSIVKSKITIKQTSQKQQKQSVSKKQTKTSGRVVLAKGVQIRAVNKTKISDNLSEGQTVLFSSTQEISNSYIKIPKGTKFTAKVVSSHRPQYSCNGGLVGLRIVSVNLNGKNQPINAGIIKIKTENILFSNLKGEHTYLKTVSKKAKWGQNIFSKWAKTSHKLANKGAGVIIAPFPYIGGCILAGASTISSPVTALLGKGGNLSVPVNTVFTIKLYEDARL